MEGISVKKIKIERFNGKTKANWVNLLNRFCLTRYFTFKKFFNLVKVYHNFRIEKHDLDNHPYKLIIDVCNVCNLRCPLCPTGKREDGRKKEVMGFKRFKSIIDQTKEYLYEVDLFSWGEPLLSEDIFKMINYAHKNNIRTKIDTNLNHFKGDFPEKIVSSGLDYMSVSLDGASQKTYEVYRKGGDFEGVIRNVKKIIAEKKRQNSKTPYLIWQFLVMKPNEKDLPRVKTMAGMLGFDILNIEAVRSDMGNEIFQNDEEKMRVIGGWLPKNEKFSRFDYKKTKKKIKRKSCMFLWGVGVINPNGSMSPCCAVYPEKYDFGNVFKGGFMKVWNNEKYMASRRIVSGKKSSIKTVCINCIKNGFID